MTPMESRRQRLGFSTIFDEPPQAAWPGLGSSGTIRGVAAIYNRYNYAAEKRAALDAWARRLDAIVSGAPAGNVVELGARR